MEKILDRNILSCSAEAHEEPSLATTCPPPLQLVFQNNSMYVTEKQLLYLPAGVENQINFPKCFLVYFDDTEIE